MGNVECDCAVCEAGVGAASQVEEGGLGRGSSEEGKATAQFLDAVCLSNACFLVPTALRHSVGAVLVSETEAQLSEKENEQEVAVLAAKEAHSFAGVELLFSMGTSTVCLCG